MYCPTPTPHARCACIRLTALVLRLVLAAQRDAGRGEFVVTARVRQQQLKWIILVHLFARQVAPVAFLSFLLYPSPLPPACTPGRYANNELDASIMSLDHHSGTESHLHQVK